MYEILFRGFYKDPKESGKIFLNGEWVNGKWVYGGTWKNARGQRFITEDDGCSGFSVIPETVGQFTGGVEFSHNEQNETLGRNIFEGDIVQISSGYSKSTGNFLLIWNDEISGFSWKHLSGKQKFFDEEIVGMKVIGNRWDNPELLEGAS
ncbi:MAG: YopX family protein [Clostridium sp.]|uniref:YopX family protein n=1 Tax=Clostridium sp. TaxID=1506 RepID=UPI00290AA962|nr:YopX family protein [Clostridium sp.]MDU7339299.1 YopX family protein [Clostridium sp.]